ncbi:enoyl-CoA hydratase-related protein [Thiomonas delicata]|uniref:Putative Enoyl-CoA hydratase (Modular protein) n=1 Tax=Thiomonas delicata TaxID=364030 RepID=A0A238D4W9_THIDL|nr:enoyl-CoA hydratase-related protein [Thiomonas delicata]SBP88357.1 putative Enoyl-CoA hydratase (Modular protein) [Thiomonas delicata]
MAQTYDEPAGADARVCVLNLQLGSAGPTMTPETAHAGIEALSTALRDPDIGVIVLTGSAEQFCAGVPAPARPAGEMARDGNAPAFVDALHDWLLALRESDKLTIAAVEGQASGAGLALALACDLIVAARHARFVLPAASQTSGRNVGALWLAAQSLPRSALAELSLLDAAMPAERAHALGLVCKLTEPGLALQQATQLARAAAQREPATLAALKGQIARAMEQPLHEVLAEERTRWLRGEAP